MKLMAPVMTRKRRFGNSRFADSYSPYGLFVLISLVSLAGCSGASPRAKVPEATMEAPAVTPEAPQQSTVTILADADTVEAGQPVSYTVNASPAPVADLTVHVEYTNTAVELAAELPATITIDAGSDAAMLTVQTATGPGGTVTATLFRVASGPATYRIGSRFSATVTVTDDDRSTATTGLPASVSAGAVLTITVHMSTPSATVQTILVLVHDFGPRQLEIHIVRIAAGATSQTVTYTVSTGYAAATDRIRAWLYGGTYAHATYVIGDPSEGRVDVTPPTTP